MSIIAKNYKRHLISMLLTAVAAAGTYFVAPFIGASEVNVGMLKLAGIGAIAVFLRELIKILKEASQHYYAKHKAKKTEVTPVVTDTPVQ